MDGEELATTLLQMTGLVLSQETVRSAVGLVTALAATTVAGTAGAAITLVDEGGARTTAATTELAAAADALQYELDEGPCLTAWRTGQPVRVDDTDGDRRWPAWSAAAARTGVRSALSAPLLAGGGPIGAIKLYGLQAGRFDEQAERVLVLFARQAAILLATARDLADARSLSRRLSGALADRDLVSQAIGVLLGRGTPGREAAFTQLAAVAEHTGRPVRDVARELLDEVLAAAGPSTG